MCLKVQAAAQQISQQFPHGIGELADLSMVHQTQLVMSVTG